MRRFPAADDLGLAARHVLYGLHHRAAQTALAPDCRGWRALRRGARARASITNSPRWRAASSFRADLWASPTSSAPGPMSCSGGCIRARSSTSFSACRISARKCCPIICAYLVSFMRRRPMNLFFPFSVTVSTIVTVLLAQKALAAEATPFETRATMLTTLMVLAIAEHWFLVRRCTPTRSGVGAARARSGGERATRRGRRLVYGRRVGDDSDYPAPPAKARWNPGARTRRLCATPAGCTTCSNRSARAPMAKSTACAASSGRMRLDLLRTGGPQRERFALSPQRCRSRW